MDAAEKENPGRISGYGEGTAAQVVSVDELNAAVDMLKIAPPTAAEVAALVAGEPHIKIDNLHAGYGKVEILHGMPLAVGKAQSLCLIGPNGAGKSTVLHAIYGFADVLAGGITLAGEDITHLPASEKLARAGIAYILQDNSIFPDMTVEENLLLGGYTLPKEEAAEQTAYVLQKYDRLRARAKQPARALSGGERRLLEISRALITKPSVLLVDEPSIGLEPRYIDMVFEILTDLLRSEHKTIVMVEQNAKKGLAFADIGYVLAAGNLVMAGKGDELLQNPDVGRLFLGG